MASGQLKAPHSSSLLAHLQGAAAEPSTDSLEQNYSGQLQLLDDTDTEAEEAKEDARVEIMVTNPRCAAQMQNVGIAIMYYCTKCGHSSDQLLNVTEHLETGCEAMASLNDAAIREAAQKFAQQQRDNENGDHEYMEQSVRNESCTKEGPSSSDEEDLHKDPRKWYCKWCQYTPLYSRVDLDQHRKCHGESGKEMLTCYACPKEIGPSSSDWCRVRSHLFHFHKVHFQLQCEHCDTVFRGHTDYNKHVSSHKHRCSWHFCKYSSFSPSDVVTHEKCHTGMHGRHFRCYICKYQNKQLPGKWGSMHAHLVSKHRGVIGARYSCGRCGKGFQELRKYHQHMPCKHADKSHDDAGEPGSQSAGQDVSPGKVGVNDEMLGNMLVRKSLRLAQKIKQKSNPEALERNSVNNDADIKTKAKPNVQPDETVQSRANRDPVTVMASPTDDDVLAEKDSFTTAVSDSQSVVAAAAESPPNVCKQSAILIKVDENFPGGAAEDGAKPKCHTAHSIPKTHRCHLCYKRFASEARLQRHMLHQHSEEKMQRVSCPVCGKDFRNPMQMRNHKREVHEGKKRSRSSRPNNQKWFMCDTCTYTTPEASRLRNHKLSSHEGILPYKCTQCQYRTNEKSDLYRHRWKHRPVKRYQCSECSYTTNTRWVLVNHCAKQHSIELPRLHRNTLGSTHGSKHLTKQLEKQWAVDSQLLSVIGNAQLQALNTPDSGAEVCTEVQVNMQTTVQSPVQDIVANAQPELHSVVVPQKAAGQLTAEIGEHKDLPVNIQTGAEQLDSGQEVVPSDNVRVVYVQADQIEQSPLALITVLSEDSPQPYH